MYINQMEVSMDNNPVELTFGERLQDLRKKRKLSQEYVGKVIGVDRTTVGSYENDEMYPRYENIVKLAELFNVSYDYLFGYVEVDINASMNELYASLGTRSFTINDFNKHALSLDDENRKYLLKALLALEYGWSIDISKLFKSITISIED